MLDHKRYAGIRQGFRSENGLVRTLTAIAILGLLLFSAVLADAWLSGKLGAQRVPTPIPNPSTPLDQDVIEHMCQVLDLPTDDRRCLAFATVYAPDYFGEIEAFSQRLSTEVEVDAVFGRYKVSCGSIMGEGEDATYTCMYDLHGDGVNPFFCRFRPDGTLIYLWCDPQPRPTMRFYSPS